MGQSLHFNRIKIKWFDAQGIQIFDDETILRMLKAGLDPEKSSIDETTYESFFESIEISVYLSANEPKIEKLLGTGAKNLLHPNSRCYFVTEGLWKVIEEMIFKQAGIKSQEIREEYLDDWASLKHLYTQKRLMVEAS